MLYGLIIFHALVDDLDISQLQVDFGLRKNRVFLPLLSISVNCFSGEVIANGIPGRPAPLPISSTVWTFDIRLHHQTVEQMFAHHFFDITNRGKLNALFQRAISWI